jgi:hypothetical protein
MMHLKRREVRKIAKLLSPDRAGPASFSLWSRFRLYAEANADGTSSASEGKVCGQSTDPIGGAGHA